MWRGMIEKQNPEFQPHTHAAAAAAAHHTVPLRAHLLSLHRLHRRHLRLRELALGAAFAALAVQDALAVAIHFQLGDHALGRLDGDRRVGAVDLLPGEAVDVDDPLAAVDGRDLALAALVRRDGERVRGVCGSGKVLSLLAAHRNAPSTLLPCTCRARPGPRRPSGRGWRGPERGREEGRGERK